MNGEKTLLIINRRAKAGCSDLDEALDFLGTRFDLRREFAEPPQRIAELLDQFGGEAERVILGGGDGTFNRAAASLLKCGKPLGILPLGTANDLARTLKIPSDPLAAAKVIAGGRTLPIDLGCVNGDIWFFNVAHVGLGTIVTRRLSGDRKKLWGKAGYLRSLLEAWRAARPFDVELLLHGHREHFRSIEVAVGNGRSYGGGMTVASGARIDDAVLHLFSLDPQGILRLAALVPALFTGDYGKRKGVRLRSGEEMTVRTDKPMRVVTDGEERAMTPARFTVRQRALRVFVPPENEAEEEECCELDGSSLSTT